MHWTDKLTAEQKSAHYKWVRSHVKKKGGFSVMDKKQHKLISSRGGRNAWHKDEKEDNLPTKEAS